jgi:hypothetical protein
MTVTAVQKGISLPALQRLLGHDRLATTEIYLSLSLEEVLREFWEKWSYGAQTSSWFCLPPCGLKPTVLDCRKSSDRRA